MREGYSTSACAAAAAAAALTVLLGKEKIEHITIDLPGREGVNFRLARCEVDALGVCCGVIKDAGDDPDVTNGLEIQAYIRRSPTSGITLLGGKGVGRATLAGLPVAPGEAAINPASRKLIEGVIFCELERLHADPDAGYEVTIQVPGGEETAQKTMNPKLGIVGGISILGTDGLVRPYSSAAFRTSLYYALRVARENGSSKIGMATGKRSAAYLSAVRPDLTALEIVDVGDELAYPIKQAYKLGFSEIVVGGMIGKLSKVAQGRMQTHVRHGEIDFDFLAYLAAMQGAIRGLCDKIRKARTAHQVQGWLKTEGIHIEEEIARRAAEQIYTITAGWLAVTVLLFDLNGDLLGQASLEAAHVR